MMNHNALIDRLIRIKDGLTERADRDAINEACALIAWDRDAKALIVGADFGTEPPTFTSVR